MAKSLIEGFSTVSAGITIFSIVSITTRFCDYANNCDWYCWSLMWALSTQLYGLKTAAEIED